MICPELLGQVEVGYLGLGVGGMLSGLNHAPEVVRNEEGVKKVVRHGRIGNMRQGRDVEVLVERDGARRGRHVHVAVHARSLVVVHRRVIHVV